LRVTLNAVLGFAQIMALDEGLNDNNRQYLQEISDAGSRLLDVVGRILNLVSLETGDASLANETFNLSLLVEEIVGHSAGAANTKGVMLDFPHENIDTAYEICGDQQCLKQVLSYVFSDAVKNAASGSRLVVGFEKQRGDIRIEIKTAIPGNENGQPVTTPQAADFSRQDQGGANNTRIELLITQTLLELMGGTMRYEFNPDKVVAITIPAQIQAMDEVEDELPEDSSHEHSTAEEKVILYIEDDDASIRLVETLLRQRPYCRLLATRDPAQCAALVERHQPALILLDANIPGSDGYKLLEQWRDEPALQQIPVIVVTTDAMPDEVNKASKAGAVELLAKPIEINRFLTVIDSFVTTQHTEALKKIKTS
jgi:CheY-like chemotaxis protein